jgi:ribosomal protein L11 methylase PrmA
MLFTTLIFYLLLAAFLFAVWVIYTELFGSGYQPVPDKSAKKMIEFSNLNKTKTVIDLGCGNGKLLAFAAPKCKNAIGVELDPIRFLFSKFALRKQKNVEVFWGNLFDFNLTKADVVFIFLRQPTNNKLKNKFLKEMKKGSIVVSYVWKMDLPLIKEDALLKVRTYRVK